MSISRKDRSPDGTIGMAGNVSEWTASWSQGNQFPIIKGGNFSLPLMPLGEQIEITARPGEEFIGFRTISRHAPGEIARRGAGLHLRADVALSGSSFP